MSDGSGPGTMLQPRFPAAAPAENKLLCLLLHGAEMLHLSHNECFKRILYHVAVTRLLESLCSSLPLCWYFTKFGRVSYL